MGNTSPINQRALQHDALKASPRQREPGEEVWRLIHRDGRAQSCELRDNSGVGAGWDVMFLEDGEPLFSRRCPDVAVARYVAESAKRDLLRTGWVEEEHS
jgi:hypothetical protein